MMNIDLRSKGFEVELFTGLFNGQNVGVSSAATQELDGFVKEPDQRNLEFITSPEKNYSLLKEALLQPRRDLRSWLAKRDLTILPGSTLSLGNTKKFERSDLSNPYHELIEKKYGTKVVTTSVHINLGIKELPSLFSALRLVRCEAALFLSLSASSPFLGGLLSGVHSQRWLQFPRTPMKVPLFEDHSHYVGWVEEMLKNGIMSNERHLWTSVRPNGPKRPYSLDRLELRICDLITDCDLLLAVTALLELRVLSLIEGFSQLDPFNISKLNMNQLSGLCDLNDIAAAKFSLDASLNHWIDGKSIICRDWIQQVLNDVTPLANSLGISSLLIPIHKVLDQGNQAMKWIKSYSDGKSISLLLEEGSQAMRLEEVEFFSKSVIVG